MVTTAAPPKVHGLAIQEVWPDVKNNLELISYLPDVKDGYYPPRDYFYAILATLFADDYGGYSTGCWGTRRTLRPSRRGTKWLLTSKRCLSAM